MFRVAVLWGVALSSCVARKHLAKQTSDTVLYHLERFSGSLFPHQLKQFSYQEQASHVDPHVLSDLIQTKRIVDDMISLVFQRFPLLLQSMLQPSPELLLESMPTESFGNVLMEPVSNSGGGGGLGFQVFCQEKIVISAGAGFGGGVKLGFPSFQFGGGAGMQVFDSSGNITAQLGGGIGVADFQRQIDDNSSSKQDFRSALDKARKQIKKCFAQGLGSISGGGGAGGGISDSIKDSLLYRKSFGFGFSFRHDSTNIDSKRFQEFNNLRTSELNVRGLWLAI